MRKKNNSLLAFILAATLAWARPSYASNFLPGETTAPLAAGISSSSVAFMLSASTNSPDVMACNASQTIAFGGCGPSTVTATTPAAGALNATPILPFTCTIFRKGVGNSYCAAITLTGSATLYFTAGQGD